MSKCIQCGAELSETSRFCPECGTPTELSLEKIEITSSDKYNSENVESSHAEKYSEAYDHDVKSQLPKTSTLKSADEIVFPELPNAIPPETMAEELEAAAADVLEDIPEVKKVDTDISEHAPKVKKVDTDISEHAPKVKKVDTDISEHVTEAIPANKADKTEKKVEIKSDNKPIKPITEKKEGTVVTGVKAQPASAAKTTQPAKKAEIPEVPKKKSGAFIVVVVIILLAAIVVAALTLLSKGSSGNEDPFTSDSDYVGGSLTEPTLGDSESTQSEEITAMTENATSVTVSAALVSTEAVSPEPDVTALTTVTEVPEAAAETAVSTLTSGQTTVAELALTFDHELAYGTGRSMEYDTTTDSSLTFLQLTDESMFVAQYTIAAEAQGRNPLIMGIKFGEDSIDVCPDSAGSGTAAFTNETILAAVTDAGKTYNDITGFYIRSDGVAIDVTSIIVTDVMQ